MSISSIWLIDRTLLGATTPCQGGPGSNGIKRVLHVYLSFKAGSSPSDVLIIYRTLIGSGGSYWSAEMLSVYSTAPIFVIWCTIRQDFGSSEYFLLRLWRKRISLDCDMMTLNDTLWGLLTGFVYIIWSMASESTLLCQPDMVWSFRFLLPKRNPLNYLFAIMLSTSS